MKMYGGVPGTHGGGSQSRSRRYWEIRDSNSDLSVVQPVASNYNDCFIVS
jgi:hypothetical protein